MFLVSGAGIVSMGGERLWKLERKINRNEMREKIRDVQT